MVKKGKKPMKVAIRTSDGKELALIVSSSFKVLVDNEVILEHSGDYKAKTEASQWVEDFVGALGACKEKACKCRGSYGKGSDASSLWKEEPEYITCKSPNSSFIENFQWWANEELLGENAMEIYFKNGNYVSYVGVPCSVALGFKSAIQNGESAGGYYNTYIRGIYEVVSIVS